MAKRAAAGTLALAVCLGGGVLGAGAANAALAAGGGLVRPMPTADPSASGDRNVDAPIISAGTQGAALSDFQVVLPNDWDAGDRVAVSLPAGIEFASAPTVKVAGVEVDAVADLDEEATPETTAPAGVTAPAFGAAVIPTVGSPGVADPNQALIQFTNTSQGDPADADWILTFSAVKVNVPKSVNLTGDAITVKVTGYNASGTPTTYAASTTYNDAITTLGFVSPIEFKADSASLIPGGGPQTIGSLSLSEVIPEGLIDGEYTISFDQNGTPVPVDPSLEDNDSASLDVDVTGDAELVEGSASATPAGSFTFEVDGLEDGATTTLESFAVTGLRLSPQPNVTTPINVTLTAAPVAGFNGSFDAVNQVTAATGTPENDTFSFVPDEDGVEAAESIGIVPQDNRIGGNDRYETAAQIALQVTEGGTSNVIIASGEPGSGGVDALSANYLAGTFPSAAPVLLTKRDSLPDATLVAVRTILQGVGNNGTANIYVVGGPSAVTDKVLGELRDSFSSTVGNLTVQRVAGDDRYATASSAATLRGQGPVGSFVGTFGKGSAKTAFLTNGVAPADALAAGPIAYANGFPLLQTTPSALPESTLTALDSLGIKQVVIVGGTAVVPEAIATSLTGRGINVIRVGGEDRYATSKLLNELAHDSLAAPDNISGGLNYADPVTPLLANGIGFADALVSGPLAGSTRTARGIIGYSQNVNGTSPADDITPADYSGLPDGPIVGDDNDKTDYSPIYGPPIVLSGPQPLLLTDKDKLSKPTADYIRENDSITMVQGVGLSGALSAAVLIEANKAAAE